MIRAETPADHARVFAVQRAAFGQDDEAELVVALRAEAHPQLSLVAELDGRVVGHAFFSPVSARPPDLLPPACGFAPLGVHPDQQARGVGSALVRAGLAGCAELGWQAVFLVGNPAYYGRFGFVPASRFGLRYGVEALEPAFQARELRPGALRACRGRVRYHPAFERLG